MKKTDEKIEEYTSELIREYTNLSEKVGELAESIRFTYDFNMQYYLKLAQLSAMETYQRVLKMRIKSMGVEIVEYDRT